VSRKSQKVTRDSRRNDVTVVANTGLELPVSSRFAETGFAETRFVETHFAES